MLTLYTQALFSVKLFWQKEKPQVDIDVQTLSASARSIKHYKINLEQGSEGRQTINPFDGDAGQFAERQVLFKRGRTSIVFSILPHFTRSSIGLPIVPSSGRFESRSRRLGRAVDLVAAGEVQEIITRIFQAPARRGQRRTTKQFATHVSLLSETK